jgi:hypothetical protein
VGCCVAGADAEVVEAGDCAGAGVDDVGAGDCACKAATQLHAASTKPNNFWFISLLFYQPDIERKLLMVVALGS